MIMNLLIVVISLNYSVQRVHTIIDIVEINIKSKQRPNYLLYFKERSIVFFCVLSKIEMNESSNTQHDSCYEMFIYHNLFCTYEDKQIGKKKTITKLTIHSNRNNKFKSK